MEYLKFVHTGKSKSGKTDVYEVRATRDNFLLGTIKWMGRWRCYAFWTNEAIYNDGCLEQIAAKLEELTMEHRNGKNRPT